VVNSQILVREKMARSRSTNWQSVFNDGYGLLPITIDMPKLKVIVLGRGRAIVDMGGRKKTSGRTSGRAKAFNRRPTGYRLNGQGTALIRNLNRTAGASRYIWPAALKNQNLIDNSIERSLQEASAKVNRNLLVVK
jgi:hypothetical protein